MDKRELFDATKGKKASSRIGALLAPIVDMDTEATVTNFDGFPAHEHDLKSDYARTVLANIVKGNFYTQDKEQLAEAVKIHKQMVKQDALYHLKGLVLARQLNMKIQVKLGIACWDWFIEQTVNGKNDKFGCLPMEADKIEKILTDLLATFHPGQILEYIEILKTKAFGKGFGTHQKKRIVKVMQGWDAKLTETYTLKYRSQLRDIVQIVHPTKSDLGERFELYKYCLDKKAVPGKRQEAFKVVNKETDVEKFGKAIIDNELPWDLFKNHKLQNPRSWFARMMQMGTNALLLNVASLDRHEVFKFDEAHTYMKDKLDAKNLTRARLLPLDVLKPYMMTSNKEVKNILLKAFADSFSYKLPDLEGKRVGVTIDCSGSMSGDPITRATAFAASFIPSIGKDLWLTFFDTELYEAGSRKGSVRLPDFEKCTTNEQIVKEIFKVNNLPMGGTNTGLFIDRAMKDGKVLDVLIILTDEQQNDGAEMYKQFKRYKNRFNKNALLVVINVTEYRWHNVPQNDPSIVVFQSINSNILKTLPYLMSGTEKLIDNIKLEG